MLRVIKLALDKSRSLYYSGELMTQSELEVIQWRYIVEYIKEKRDIRQAKRLVKYLKGVEKLKVNPLGYKLQPEIMS